ncbi:hypothetical protein LEN26_010109 [Aphanomyces euteiches]|nr:hypothetical protein AeMF1_012108 [Aphanomyces euteiches]KAH9122809.1 hypothetical protein LEN26_010109 [Aphanomyces euteiches]KAH9193294.1 hypothetical protein AeNC1_004720 [Aphanomyces euteiches]
MTDLTPTGWKYVGAIALVVAAAVLRKEMIRIALSLLMRVLSAQRYKNANSAIREFEKLVMYPLSWALFVMFVLIAMNMIDFSWSSVTTFVILILGVALMWTVYQFCAFLSIVIIRQQGWERSNTKDDSSKIMIVTEGIGLLKYLLWAFVLYYCFFNQLEFNTTEIFITTVLVVEVLFVLSSHTWFRNVMGGLVLLIDEPVKSGSHVHILGHEGVIEHMYLQYFAVRQYDQGLAYIPNGIVFNHPIDVRVKSLDSRFALDIQLDPQHTSAHLVREFVRNVDHYLAQQVRSSTASATVEIDYAPKASKPALSDIIRVHLVKKDSAQTLPPPRFWVVLNGLFTVEVVYFLAPNQRFRQHVAEKRQIVLGITRLIHDMNLVLYDPTRGETNALASMPDENRSPSDLDDIDFTLVSEPPTPGATTEATITPSSATSTIRRRNV